MRTEYSDEHRTTFIPMKAAQLHTMPKTFDFPGIKLPESSGLCTQLGSAYFLFRLHLTRMGIT